MQTPFTPQDVRLKHTPTLLIREDFEIESPFSFEKCCTKMIERNCDQQEVSATCVKNYLLEDTTMQFYTVLRVHRHRRVMVAELQKDSSTNRTSIRGYRGYAVDDALLIFVSTVLGFILGYIVRDIGSLPEVTRTSATALIWLSVIVVNFIFFFGVMRLDRTMLEELCNVVNAEYPQKTKKKKRG
jgi:hypothetical protein